MRVRLLADDLTGALDASVRLTRHGRGLPVVWDVAAALKDNGALALVTHTREGFAEDAVRAICSLREFWRADSLAFKKIDSLWRGNTTVEVIALIESKVFATVLIAAAFPEQNRITSDGRQYWRRSPSESWQLVPQNLRSEMIQRGIVVNVVAADAIRHSLSSSSMSVAGVWMCDAQSNADLEAIVEFGSRADGPLLWCGTAGLAGALGDAFNGGLHQMTPTRINRPVTAIVGTQHPVSRAQVGAIEAVEDVSVLKIGIDRPLWDALIAHAVVQAAAGHPVVFWFTPDIKLDSDQAEAAMNDFLQRLVARYRPPGPLLVTGGETLFRLCRAAGATRLLTGMEVAPGVATGTFVDGLWGGISFVSKSGAFGRPDFFTEFLHKGSI